MIDFVQKLETEKADLQERIKKIDHAVAAIQAVCEHEFIEIGHDSHYRYFTCQLCNKTETV